MKGASWHHHISPILRHLDPGLPDDLQEFSEALHRFNLAPHTDRSAQSIRRESEAREQLVLDFALSTDVYSAEPFTKASLETDLDNLETMSRATEALSLQDAPPAVHFGYLRPMVKPKAGDSNADEVSGPDGFAMPLGVRLLLQEWEVGTSPLDYNYVDPYDGSPQEARPSRRTNRPHASQTTREPAQGLAHSQRPPLVVPSYSIAPPVLQPDTRRPVVTQSQGFELPKAFQPFGSQLPTVDLAVLRSSQDFGASTQILSGPYGSRSSLMKKKPAKKRLGGF